MPMKFGGLVILSVLTAVLLAPSIVSAAGNCRVIAAATESIDEASRKMVTHQHGMAKEVQQAVMECPCCDDCNESCISPACNPVGGIFVSGIEIPASSGLFVHLVSFWFDEPELFPPFRPPIRLA